MNPDASPGPTSAPDAWAPDACTLPVAHRPLRVAEFDDLFAQTLVRSERLSPRHLRLTLAGGPDVAATARDLAGRESQCCSFFSFTICAPAPERVAFDIEVPATQIEVLSALADRAAAARDTA